MAELRRNPITGQWVVIDADRSLGPAAFMKEDHTPRHGATCPFCPGREDRTPPEVDALRPDGSAPNTPGWRVRVVSNKFPALKIEGDLDLRDDGVFSRSNGIGAHEVLIETPDHARSLADFSEGEMLEVIRKYQARIVDLAGDKRFNYIVVFKNYGESAGTSVEHPHSQIIALPMVPKYVLEEIKGTQHYYNSHKRCVFCDIIRQESEEKERVVVENDDFIVFCPFVPRYEFECWILPKKHSSEFATISGPEQRSLAAILKETLFRIKSCLRDPSYNFYFHIAPVNYKGYKSFHWHIEIVPNLSPRSGIEWTTGFYVVRTDPAAAARHLRGVSGSAA